MTEDHSLGVTVDDWRNELVRMAAGDPGSTLRELMEELGLKRTALQDRLNKLTKAGRCIRGIGKRTGISGYTYSVAVYQLIKKASK